MNLKTKEKHDKQLWLHLRFSEQRNAEYTFSFLSKWDKHEIITCLLEAKAEKLAVAVILRESESGSIELFKVYAYDDELVQWYYDDERNEELFFYSPSPLLDILHALW